MSTSTLTGTELNRAMIWLYCPRLYKDHGVYCQKYCYEVIDYLSDWNLTMPLAVHMHLGVHFDKDDHYVFSHYREHQENSDNPLRAICEVLVQIGLERRR